MLYHPLAVRRSPRPHHLYHEQGVAFAAPVQQRRQGRIELSPGHVHRQGKCFGFIQGTQLDLAQLAAAP
jgi:hypothetical protein